MARVRTKPFRVRQIARELRGSNGTHAVDLERRSIYTKSRQNGPEQERIDWLTRKPLCAWHSSALWSALFATNVPADSAANSRPPNPLWLRRSTRPSHIH